MSDFHDYKAFFRTHDISGRITDQPTITFDPKDAFKVILASAQAFQNLGPMTPQMWHQAEFIMDVCKQSIAKL